MGPLEKARLWSLAGGEDSTAPEPETISGTSARSLMDAYSSQRPPSWAGPMERSEPE